MNYSKLNQDERDRALKGQLHHQVVKVFERYRLTSTPELKWISKKENSHEHVIFTQKFLLDTDAIGALFRANYLCFAKVAFFRENIDKYDPLKYDPFKGFVETGIADSDFLKHKATGKVIDHRYLQRITDIEVFKQLCDALENESENLVKAEVGDLD